jgi:hypothetical protein
MGTEVIEPADDTLHVLRAATWTAAVSTVVLSAAALIGWASGNAWLTRLKSGTAAMRPTTAACLIFLAIGVILLLQPRQRSVALATAGAAGGAGLIAALSLLEYALDRNLLSDDLLFETAVAHEPGGGRMAVATALEIVLIALALLAASRGRLRIAQGFAVIVFTGAAVAVLGYAYGERRFYATDVHAGMAFNTAVGLTLLALGLLAIIPNGVLWQLFRRPPPGALMSRRLLPWLTIAMPVIGWLRVEGQRGGLFGTGLGASIMVFAASIVVTAVARTAVMSMDRMSSHLTHAWHQYGLASTSQQTHAGGEEQPAASARELSVIEPGKEVPGLRRTVPTRR